MDIFTRIEKPTLLLYVERTRANIRQMAQKAAAQKVRFRPHFKTHQSATIGEWFAAEGVKAITVSSVDMARYFISYGWKDVTIAFPVNLRQISVIESLAQRASLGLLVESVEVARVLGEKIRSDVSIWLKVDVGSHRTGLACDAPQTFLSIISELSRHSHLNLRGLLAHAGHSYRAINAAQVCQTYSESVAHLLALRSTLLAAGSPALEISVGDTPGCTLSPQLGPVDEIRPGNFVFYDVQQLGVGACTPDQIAVALACPIVALHPEREIAVLYGGAIHLSKDTANWDGERVYGLVALPNSTRQPGQPGWGEPLPGAYVASLSQEHGLVHVPNSLMEQLHIGDLLCVLPVHSCLTAQAIGRYLTLEGERILMMPLMG